MDNLKLPKFGSKRIKVDFERTSAWERFKLKYLSFNFAKTAVWFLFRFILLIGISYIILYPFISKIMGSFMSTRDFADTTVKLIPKYPTLDTYKAIINENSYFKALGNTFLLSLTCAVIQMFICSIVGYGFAKFKFKGGKFLFLCVVLTMIVPPETLSLALFMKFKYFDIYGILGLFTSKLPSLINTYFPLMILSFGGIAFKNGLYIYLMRQFFKGVPDELEEAAYVDGSGVFYTFIKIILPTAVPMMITIFLFAFSWQWTDSFYTGLFFTETKVYLLPNIVSIPKSLTGAVSELEIFGTSIKQTCGLLIIAPLLLAYGYMQRFLVQGIARSGITGE